MKINSKIATYQIFFISLLLLNGVYSLLIPHLCTRNTGSDGVFAILLGSFLAISLVFLIHKIGMSYVDKTIIECLPDMVGKILGKIIGFVMVAFNIFITAFYLKCFVEMLVAELLPLTPRWVLVGATLLLILWIVNNGLEDIARFTTLLAPLVILASLLVIIGNIKDIQLDNFLPVFQNTSGKSFFESTMTAFSLYFTMINFLMIYPNTDHPTKIRKVMLWSIVITGLYMSVITFTLLAVFGVVSGGQTVWPTIELARMIRIGPFLERVEAAFITVWLTIAFINGSFHAYCAVVSWGQLFNCKRYRLTSYVVIAIIFVGCLIPQGILETIIIQHIYRSIIILIMLAILIILSIVIMIRGKRVVHHEK